MRPEILEQVPLICPSCHSRALPPAQRRARSLSVGYVAAEDDGGEIIDAMLFCEACVQTYPVIDGIPLLVLDLKSYLAPRLWQIIEQDRAPALMSDLLGYGPGWPNYADLCTSIDSNWGDRAEPAIEGPSPPCGQAELNERLRSRTDERVGRSLDLGCGLGRSLAELSRGTDLAIGVDLDLGSLRRARRILRGETLGYARRMTGTQYVPAEARAGDLAAPAAVLVCADAYNLPFPPSTFERVSALNLLDRVPNPPQLLRAIDEQCTSRGELLLSSPLIWQSVTPEENRPRGHDPAAAYVNLLRTGVGLMAPYEILDEGDLAWWLRSEARMAYSYRSFYVRARKATPP